MNNDIIFRYKNGRIIPIKVNKDLTTNEYMNKKIRKENNDEVVKSQTIKQGNDEYTTQPYKYGDEAFSIKYALHGTRHLTNEPFTIDGEYNFLYNEAKKEVSTGMRVNGKVVPDNWGVMTGVEKEAWLEMVKNPKQKLLPWVQGSYLD